MSSVDPRGSKKYNLQYDKAKGDFLGPPHMHLIPAEVKENKSKKEILWKQGSHTTGDSLFLNKAFMK